MLLLELLGDLSSATKKQKEREKAQVSRFIPQTQANKTTYPEKLDKIKKFDEE